MPRHQGFTMIEVLVAMLLLSSGALALLMMQMHSLRVARDGMLRSQAVMMVAELAELRAEAGAAGAAAYLFTFDASRDATGAPDCRAQACPPADFARATVAGWQARLREALPGARAVICRDARTQARQEWACDGAANSPVVAKLGWPGGAPADQPALSLFIGP